MRRDRAKPDFLPAFLRTHPYHAERREAVSKHIEELQRKVPRDKLYVGVENLRLRVPRDKKRFDE